jgi:hypothetical protein
MLKEVIIEQTNCSNVIFDLDRSDSFDWHSASIPFRAHGTSDELFVDKEKLRNFLFNFECVLVLDEYIIR